LLPLTTGSYLTVQFLSLGHLPAVVHIACKVPIAGLHFSPLLTLNFSTGSPKTAFNRHFYAPSDRR